jgi:hypothetical protein
MRMDGDEGKMLTTSAGGSRARKRFVVTAVGQALGRVRSVMVDVHSRQLRYVVVAPGQGKAPIVIPWRALYFDSTRLRLVYYTFT